MVAFEFADFTGGFEFFVASREDFEVTAGDAILRRDVTDRGMQPGAVIMADELTDDAFGILESERSFGSDGLFVQSAMEAFELAIALRVIRRAEDVGGLPEADELAEVARDELRSVVGDDPRTRIRVKLPSALDDDLRIGLLHLLANIPGEDRARGAVEHRA